MGSLRSFTETATFPKFVSFFLDREKIFVISVIVYQWAELVLDVDEWDSFDEFELFCFGFAKLTWEKIRWNSIEDLFIDIYH